MGLFLWMAGGLVTGRGALLFPSGCQVILLTGISGDVESETLYREQLQAWVDLVSRSPAAKCWILSDLTGTRDLASGQKFTVLPAQRQAFLQLGSELRGHTNPLVVVAWGHGGRQGETPVFHVRGPRLTPADFLQVAQAGAGPESHWVLLFRGSGGFATQVAGAERWVLSSDEESMFASDPVSMDVLLQWLRSHPNPELEAVSSELGKRVREWYLDQNLARTEEPTLWLSHRQPQVLVLEEAQTSSVAGTIGPIPSNPAAGGLEESAERRTPTLPEAWKDIRPVRSEQYPAADAVILRRHLAYTLAGSPAVSCEREEFIQVLTPEGKRFGDFDIAFTPPFEEIEFKDCEVLHAGGALERLEPDQIRELLSATRADSLQERRKFFSLPGVEPGVVLHVRYQSRWKEFPMPEVSLEIPLGGDVPVLESQLEVRVPKGKAFHYAVEHLADYTNATPSIQKGEYGTSYRWTWGPQPPVVQDVPGGMGQHTPRVVLSTFADWRSFGEWYSRISQGADEVTPEIAEKAKELTRNAVEERQKVLAVYNYVVGMRYVAVPLGINSFRPHAAAHVLQHCYGDCKDKANLFNALLHALNLKSELVLVPRFGQAREEVPGFAFNHAISRVRLSGETLWVDTTEDVCRFGMLPPGDAGRNVLVMDGDNHLTTLPGPVLADHWLRLRGRVDCSGEKAGAAVAMEVKAAGFPDYQLRSLARENRQKQAAVPLMAGLLGPLEGAFVLEEQKSSRIAALDEDFCWNAHGQWVGALGAARKPTQAEGNAERFLRSPFWWPMEWDLALQKRQEGLCLNQGYPLILEEELEIHLPAGWQVGTLPQNCRESQAALAWQLEWAANSRETLRGRLHAELRRGEWPAGQVGALQEQLGNLRQALMQEVTLKAEGMTKGL